MDFPFWQQGFFFHKRRIKPNGLFSELRRKAKKAGVWGKLVFPVSHLSGIPSFFLVGVWLQNLEKGKHPEFSDFFFQGVKRKRNQGGHGGMESCLASSKREKGFTSVCLIFFWFCALDLPVFIGEGG